MKRFFLPQIMLTCAVAAQAIPANAQNAPGKSTRAADAAAPLPSQCPDAKPIRNICMFIGRRTLNEGSGDKYTYQVKLKEAACVKPSDTEAIAGAKIRKAWETLEHRLVCSSADFDLTGGSALKYATMIEFEEFIDDVITWKVNLNHIDPADGMTLLDYVELHMQKHKGNDLEQRFAYYYNRLQHAGAKHRREL